MLVLTRKLGEKINIGETIQIQVIDVRGKQVRLGIVAPASFAIHRHEIYEKVRDANVVAAKEFIGSDLRNLGDLLQGDQYDKK